MTTCSKCGKKISKTTKTGLCWDCRAKKSKLRKYIDKNDGLNKGMMYHEYLEKAKLSVNKNF